MAGKNTISISFEVTDGRDGLKTLILDADALRKVMEQNVRVSQNLQETVLGSLPQLRHLMVFQTLWVNYQAFWVNLPERASSLAMP